MADSKGLKKHSGNLDNNLSHKDAVEDNIHVEISVLVKNVKDNLVKRKGLFKALFHRKIESV